MGTTFADTPGKIRREGNNQTLTFTRLTPTTGTVCWAPVPPVQGCGTPTGVYSGGVLVGSTSPISQLNKPKDGVCCYTGDPTMDRNLFAGDTLSTAHILWSDNNDQTTSCVSISGLSVTCTAYYFAFFAEDSTCRYNQDGIYSYSLELAGPEIPCVSGSQLITTNAANLFDLLPSQANLTINYPTSIVVDGQVIELVVRGNQLSTYQSLVDELSTAWKRTAAVTVSEYPPFYGEFLHTTPRWYQHMGTGYQEIFPIIQPTDPTILNIGEIWYDSASKILKIAELGGWSPVPVVSSTYDPAVGSYGAIWYDGNTARKFNGAVWVDVPSYIQPTDPAALPILDATSMWLSDGQFYKWSVTRRKWLPLLVLNADIAPTAILNGTKWLSTTDNVLSFWNGVDWISLSARVETVQPNTPFAGEMWVNPTTRAVKQFDGLQSSWTTVDVVVYHKQPNDLNAGDLHYVPAVQRLYMFDALTTNWVDVTAKLSTNVVDPSFATTVVDDSLWFNTTANMWYWCDSGTWRGCEVVALPSNPMQITSGFWYNTTTSLWYERLSTSWTPIYPTISTVDPTTPVLGATWYDGTTLRQRVTPTAWEDRVFTTTPSSLQIGSRWENATGLIYAWTGSSWAELVAPYTVATTPSNNILITSSSCGSNSFIDLTGVNILTELRLTACIPTMGNDGASGTHMTEVVGVGTDGSVDERRRIIDNLYSRLGAPTVNVELTRDKMDLAVQKGLDYLRRDSGAGYRRGYFFLNLTPGKQQYVLTSKLVGFNTIVDVLKLYRPKGGMLNAAYSGDLYSQQLLQQLYVSGTFDILSYHLLASYQTVVAKLFATDFMFDWHERSRTLRIMRQIPRAERILVDAIVEKTEQELFTDRNTKSWIEEWALAEAKMMLGEIRGKFGSMPGAGGSVTMNAESLKAESKELKEKLAKELDDFIASDVTAWGLGSSIVKG